MPLRALRAALPRHGARLPLPALPEPRSEAWVYLPGQRQRLQPAAVRAALPRPRKSAIDAYVRVSLRGRYTCDGRREGKELCPDGGVCPDASSGPGNCSFCAAFPAPPPAPEPEAHKPAARELKALLRTLGLPTDGSLAELAGRVQVALSGDGP